MLDWYLGIGHVTRLLPSIVFVVSAIADFLTHPTEDFMIYTRPVQCTVIEA